ncbi:MAG: pyridoxal-phosphate dependent enzyme [Candidatus Heimdallarchaeota archaeon]
MEKEIICQNCQAKLDSKQRSLTCPQCSASQAEFQIVAPTQGKISIDDSKKGIWRYANFLPDFSKNVSLGEGDTPIRQVSHIYTDSLNLLLKIEGSNPTGSFLDRVSPLMVSDAISNNMTSLVCASDGNLGASISAYCATEDLNCTCVVPKSTSPEKKVQMIAYGSELVEFGEIIDDSLELAKKMADESTYQATPEFNLLAVEGTKTIALEIVEQIYLSKNGVLPAIDYIIVPMGSGRLVYSVWKGFKQANEFGLITKDQLPKIIGVQLKNHDLITKAILAGDDEPKIPTKKNPSKSNRSLADAILSTRSLFGVKAIESIRESGGTAVSVTEKDMIEASKKLAQKEGVFAELSSATVIAAVEELLASNYLKKESVVLALITASGMKTTQAFERSTKQHKKVESFRSMGTKIEILRIIASGETNFGYGIWKALDQSMSLQAVYQHLKELQQADHISELVTTTRQKKYTVTEKGNQLVQKMKELEELLT